MVNVKGNVDLSNQDLTMIPVKFNQVGGYFLCHRNQLTSLEFCPAHVGGDFYCGHNPLLQKVQDIIDFKEIYQCHQATKIILIKEHLEKKISDQSIVLYQPHSIIKI